MKFRFISLCLGLLFLGTSQITAQKIKVESGSIAEIAKEKKVHLLYDYSDFKVGKDGMTEKEYVDKKVAEYNKEEPGKGDKWQKAWVDSRKTRYEPKFEELINEHLKGKGLVHGIYPDAKYTLSVKTIFLEPGYNVGVMKKPSYVSYEFVYFETADPSKVVFKGKLEEVSGAQAMGFDFDSGTRISESYAKAGKILGKYIAD